MEQNNGSSDRETGDEESDDEGDPRNSAKVVNVTTPQDDLLVLKKRHFDFDLAPPLIEVSLEI